MDVEGSGDGANRFALVDEFAGEGFLVGQELLGASERDAAPLGGDPAVVGPAENERAFELGDAGTGTLFGHRFTVASQNPLTFGNFNERGL